MALIFESSHFIIEAVDQPLIDRKDGGHIAIHPKWRVSTRQELSAEQAIELARLTIVAGEAFSSVMNSNGVDIGRLNYQDNGNWSVWSPEGPALHVHIYGRAKSATIQKYGETLDFPNRATHPQLYTHLQPLTAKDVVDVRKKIQSLLETEKYADAAWHLKNNPVSSYTSIKGILFDVIGTTVIEKDPATITDCFEKAFRDHGIGLDRKILQANRGRDKKEMITLLVQNENGALVNKVYSSFITHVKSQVKNFESRPGTVELFEYLTKKGMVIGLGTGLSEDLLNVILSYVGWSKSQFNFMGIPGGAIRSRPNPDMLLDFMRKFSLSPKEVIKVGDTVADVEEGKNAGVRTVSILAGTQSRQDLENAGPDYIIATLDELKKILA